MIGNFTLDDIEYLYYKPKPRKRELTTWHYRMKKSTFEHYRFNSFGTSNMNRTVLREVYFRRLCS